MNVKDILLIHHSHLDLGYTHSAPVVWELHCRYLNQVLDFLDETEDWPEESRPKWTCEVSAPVVRWLERAQTHDVERFRVHAESGRLAVCGMSFVISPLMSKDQLRRQLDAIPMLRAQLGVRVTTAIQHDINGVPWPLTDLLLDAGIEMLQMGINVHMGGSPPPRPGAFRWQTPRGRELLVLNANHYTSFEQIFVAWERSIDKAREGWAKYVDVLKSRNYAHDFICLSGCASPELWDNSPPNPDLATFVRAWNEGGNVPTVRYATPEDVLSRLKEVPTSGLALHVGDWTDYWNFGVGAAARGVAWSRQAKRKLATARTIGGGGDSGDCESRALGLLDRYDEHTWCFSDTTPGLEPCVKQDALKAALVAEGSELADYVLVDRLEGLAGNPDQWGGIDHVLLVNPTDTDRCECVEVPRAWRTARRQFQAQRFAWHNRPGGWGPADWCGPVALPAKSWKRVVLAELKPAAGSDGVVYRDLRKVEEHLAPDNCTMEEIRVGDCEFETPHHLLRYNPRTGRVLELTDRATGWSVLPEDGEFDLFALVRERPDPTSDARREGFYERDQEKEKHHLSCWKPWRHVRGRPMAVRDVEWKSRGPEITLSRTFDMLGTRGITQRITLREDTPVITLDMVIEKEAHPEAESLYVVVPLALPEGWRGHFDTAGQPVELDAEQVPGSCRNWVTADTFAAIHGGGHGAAVFCPDAPLFQLGNFHFGPPLDAVPRQANPLLLGWPLNNYWNTNYPVVQPGTIRLRYGLLTFGRFDVKAVQAAAEQFANPPVVHPAGPGPMEGSL